MLTLALLVFAIQEDYRGFVEAAARAVEWPAAVPATVDLTFNNELRDVKSMQLPEDGHMPWLADADTVATVDLRDFADGRDVDWFTVMSAPLDGGNAILLKGYWETREELRTALALVYKNRQGRAHLIKARLSQTAAPTMETVEDLGRGGGSELDDNTLIAALHRDPRRAARLLARELDVVDPDRWPEDRGWHMLWCVRGLESLADREFKFKTAEPLSAEQREFLHADEPMNYYAAWMSHNKFYVAPRDVQDRVVTAWQRWVSENARTLTPAKEPRRYAP